MNKPDINYYLYLQREHDFFHQPYQYEQTFYQAIVQGDVDFIHTNQIKYASEESTSNEVSGKGALSDDPVRNERYHFIINAAMIARYCINAGYPQENAFTLSDLYIRKADQADSVAQLQQLNDQMALDFATRMKDHIHATAKSTHIRKCVDFIHSHLHEKITLDMLADYTNLNASYLSTLFKKETGYSIHSYISNIRLETAASMLRCSDHPIAEIAHTMNYSSQSHFIKAFREKYSVTPSYYRKMHHFFI